MAWVSFALVFSLIGDVVFVGFTVIGAYEKAVLVTERGGVAVFILSIHDGTSKFLCYDRAQRC